MEKIRAGIIGCGKIARTHALAYQALEESELIAASDLNIANAERIGNEFNIQAYSDVQKMIRENGLNAVSVCTPHPAHKDMIVAAAEAGAHVICEKPLAPNLKDCDEAIAACDKAGVKLAVISQRRYYPPVQRMVKAINEGKIGKPIIGTMEVLGWRSPEYYLMDGWRGKWKEEGGGVMVNQTPHQLDLLQWIMGDIDELFGYWDNFNHPTVEVEDTALAVLRFKNGSIGHFFVSNSVNPGLWGKIRIFGDKGTVVSAQVEGGSSFVSGVTTKVEPAYTDLWTVQTEPGELEQWKLSDTEVFETHDPMTYFHRLQIADFLGAIRENRKPLVDGREGRKTVEMFVAVYRSQRDGNPIKFPLQDESDDSYDGRRSYQPISRRKAAC
ncbi:MAG: Gfo/Idh/MocA family oxidoreductase [Chloroflexi bacterium]|nr:Gfo/Idh/MocA family oxidoreductase [Chloroflexota bacterium]